MNSFNYYYNKELKDFARKLRKNSTQAEIKLWKEALGGGQMHGSSFLRQRPVLNYIADFMCKELMLIIEVDGFTHGAEKQWQKELESVGFIVLRFADNEVLGDIDNVIRSIEGWVLHHPPAPPSKGENHANSKDRD